jgi:hypothetical protein
MTGKSMLPRSIAAGTEAMTDPTPEQLKAEFHAIRHSPAKIEDWARRNVPKLLKRLVAAEAAAAGILDAERFREHLDSATEVVATWPEWKRNILG